MVPLAAAYPLIAPIVTKLGIAGTKAFLRSPAGKSLLTKIMDTAVGSGAVAYGAERLGLDHLIDKIIIDTPEGKVFAPDKPEEQTLEEWKKQQESFPGGESLPETDQEFFPIPNIEDMTGPLITYPVKDETPQEYFPIQDEEQFPSILTMASKGVTSKEMDKVRKEISGKLEKYFEDKDEFTKKDLEKDFVFKTFEKVFDKYGIKRTDLRGNVREDYTRLFNAGYISEDTLNKLKKYGINRRVKITGIHAEQVKGKKLAVDEKSKLALEYLTEMQSNNPDTPITVNQPFLYKKLSEKFPDLFPLNKSETRMREVIREIRENEPAIDKFIGVKKKINPETLVPEEPRQMNLRREQISKAMNEYYPNEIIESINPKIKERYFNLKDKKDQVSLQANPKFKFYEFLARTMPETDVDTLFKKVKLGDPSDLSNPAQRLFNGFKKFEDVRKEVNPLLKPFIQRIFGNDRASIQIAHSFKASKLNIPKSKKTTEEVVKDIDPEKFIGQGINPDFLYLDISPYNQGIQNTLESKASAALEKKDFEEFDKIDQLMEVMGVEGVVGGQTIGKRKKLSVKLRSLINELEDRGESIPEYDNVMKAIQILQSSGKSGYRTGGIVGINQLTRPLRNFSS